jgi:protein-S-isoprenylcysteine O-methyltransferase Ste14
MARFHTHNHRDGHLTGEHGMGDAGQIVLIVLFTATWITDTFVFRITTFLNQYISLGIRIPICVILLISGAYLAKTGISIVFGANKEHSGVIQEHVFNMVRHPIYLSEILLYLGFLILSISLASALIWILAILFLHFISRHEEKLLLQRFGKEYEQYMHDVPMWIPRLRKK